MSLVNPHQRWCVLPAAARGGERVRLCVWCATMRREFCLLVVLRLDPVLQPSSPDPSAECADAAPVRLLCHLPAETGRGFAVTRICGGTGHIQRMVVARQLLR